VKRDGEAAGIHQPRSCGSPEAVVSKPTDSKGRLRLAGVLVIAEVG
jgi:hypothetical protein